MNIYRNATVYILQTYSLYYRVSVGDAISARANNIATSLPHLRRRKLAFVYVGDILATGQSMSPLPPGGAVVPAHYVAPLL